MTGDCHVRFCERRGVRLPSATHPAPHRAGGVHRAYRTPKILDRQITLAGCTGPIRQIAITDLGHEQPTLLLANQLRRGPAGLIETYAKRMLIENAISEGVDFFHMDALSSMVAMKVNCDLQLTLMASSLYRLFAAQIAGTYTTAESRHIYRDFINAPAHVTITDTTIEVRFGKRAHNPYLLDADLANTDVSVPWWEGRKLKLTFG